MKNLKKYISVMLSVLMMLSPLNVLTAYADSSFDAAIHNGINTINYPDLSIAVMPYYWSEGTTLTLLRNVEVSESIVVPSGTHTLDLNGYGIRATGSGYSVITVPSDSELILNDSGSNEHKYTVDENGVATVNDNAEEGYSTFSGGYITGASGESLNGGGVSNSGTFTMNGGTIIGNSTGSRGGGISNSGTANINGGLITYNRANGWGGGIYLSDTVANTVNLNGGSITNNISGNGGGIHVSENDRVNVSGSPIVSDNLSTGNNPNNLNLSANGIIGVTSELGSGASIGVKRSDKVGIITDSENTEYNVAERFFSDDPGFVVGKDKDSAQLKIHGPYTVKWLNENDEVLETDSKVAEGEIPTYNGETPTKPGDTQGVYVFDKWTPEVAPTIGYSEYRATYIMANPVARVNDTEFATIEEAAAAENWTQGSTLTLLRDISTSATITVPSGEHTLDLNGCGLRAGASDFSVINVPSDAELTLNDSGSTEHKYTVDENGLAIVNDDAEGDYSTFTGGYITGASGSSLIGGGINNCGTLTMNGGTIIGNSTGNKGAGISNSGSANINGGLITYNRAIGWGGGIYLSDTTPNTVNLAGSTITHNAAGNGGGIHISAGDTVNISGSPIVSDNLSINSNPEPELNNVNLAQNGIIKVTGQLGNHASIGVRSSDGASIITNSANNEYNDAAKFSSDNSDYIVGKDIQSGQLKLHTPYTIEWVNYNDDVLERDTDIAEGTVPTYDGETPVKPGTSEEAYIFDKWTPEIEAANSDAVYKAAFKTATPVARINGVLYSTIEEASKAVNWVEGSTMTLLADIGTTATVTVPDGVHTLDLNGFGLRATGSGYSVITVPANAELTLNDSGSTEHKYTVDENGLAIVNDDAEGDYSTFSGGYITGASGNSLSGGGINNRGTFTMNGGTIIGNSTGSRGGGISNFGTANINGGLITYNRATGWGGGIYLSDTVANTVNLNGGSITNNIAGNGGGIHVSVNDRVNVSGSPIVSDNLSTGNNPNNINLSSNGIIGVTGELGSSASIGVKMSSSTGLFTNSADVNYNDESKFISDNTNLYIGKTSEGQLKLYTPYTIQWLNYDEAVLETDTDVAEGAVPTYDGETPVKPDDEEYTYTFEGWTPDVVAATADAQYTATFTAVPKPKTYTVTWLNYDGAILKTDTDVAEGTVPVYDGETPVKPDDEQYTYTFDKWSPEISEVSADVTYTATFSSTKFIAKVGDKRFTTFSDAVEESEKTKGGKVITLLADADAPYSMNSLTYDVLRVKHEGYSADITDYKRKETNKGVTYYYRTEDKVYVDGTGDDDGIVEIAAAAAATVIVVGAGVEVVLGAGASVVVEGAAASSINVDVSDSESECIEEEELEDGSKKYTNHKFHWVTIDTGISILDAGSEILPDCVNEIWDTYNQNVATIIKILPPVINIVGYTDIILKFPYPEGWFFPPIPYLPEAMNPGSHFIAFFEGTTSTSYGTPFLGKTITEDLEITGIWVPYEAAVIEEDGDREYYLQFSEACEERDDQIVEILSAPLFDYTLQKVSENPDVYEVLRVKRGKYMGECVFAPANLPEGYYMKVWTYQDEEEGEITCYTITNEYTVKWVVNGVTVETDEDVEYGSTPEYNGETPASYFDGNNKYTFSGWSPEITPVTQSVTYTATYTAEPVDGYNLSLDDCIHLNLYIDVDDYVDAQNAKLTVAHNDPDMQSPTPITEAYSGEELIALKDADDGRYVVKVLAAPAQLRDEMTVTLYNGEEYIRSFTVSVADYCEAIINLYTNSEDKKEQQLVELAKTILDYGKACSSEFSYNESAFASQDYINTGSVSIDGTIQAEGKSGIFKGYSYIAKSIPSLRIYINKTEAQCVIDGLVATVTDANGNVREIVPTVVEGTDKVCLDITGILAENLDQVNVIEYDGATLTINANQYAKAKGGDFGRSLFNYGVAAKNYFKGN